ncbi:MAG: DUF4351 domain-containing protein [Magnetococcus sp. DMHC-1]
MLKTLLEPVGIEVRSEVQVVSAPPKADLILIQRRAGGQTEKQRLFLADGLWDLDADHILAELKITESLDETALSQITVYDTLYLETAHLERHQLRSVIISSITPRREFLERFAFEPVGPVGVHESRPLWGGVLRLIFLNELADDPRNAALKCFASRQDERRKAFKTIKQAGLFKLSEAFGHIIVGLWRLQMKSSMPDLEMEMITPEYVAQLGKEWLDFLVDTTPDKELFSLPKLEHRLVQEYRDGCQEGERNGEKKGRSKMLTRQLERRFGHVPDWASEKIAKANQPTLEEWCLRILDAQSLHEVFAEP